MPVFDVRFYDANPAGIFSTRIGSSFTWTGPALATGSATITDNEPGIQGLTLDDDSAGGETATADVTVNGLTSTGSTVDAELAWTILDTVTGQTFQVVQFQVEVGGATGFYTLSEIPLVVGRSYQVLAYDTNPNAAAGDPAFNYTEFTDGIVSGTVGNDTIDAGYSDSHGDAVDDGIGGGVSGNDDVIDADGGNDIVLAGLGNDTVFGGAGNDTLDGGTNDDELIGESGQDSMLGGDGNDTIYGGSDPTNFTGTGGTNTVSTSFQVMNLGNFADIDPDETNGITENMADLFGTYGGLDDPLYGRLTDVVTSDPNGSGNVDDNDNGATPETITIGGVAYNIDSVQVYNATLTFADGTTGNISAVVFQTTTGDVFLAPELAVNADNALMTSKPIVSISLNSVNADNGSLAATRVDADFKVPTPDESGDFIDGGAGDDLIFGNEGDDTLTGSTGEDTLYGGTGNDILFVSQGDAAFGSDGDDLFIIEDLGEAGSGTINIVGGEGNETGGDTLQLNADVTPSDITFTNTDDAAGGLSGNFTMADGTVVTFSEIENIICFTPGARILTPHGERAIETLRPGDMVITRDHGPRPIRWIGSRRVAGVDKFAPISIAAHVLDGATRPLLVSPQHRLLFTGYKAELLFGCDEVLVAARHLVDGRDVVATEQAEVTYIHMMLDEHEVVYADGAATESFHAGDIGISAISDQSRDEMFRVFPELRANPNAYGKTARPCLKRHEARLLLPTPAPVLIAA
ncbi:MAG: Hint domain-containing protein [Roseovarius sp.]|nr:Hint domain-containing protein [Roseovarius sp.]